jgi:hypothetical protein
MPRAKQSVDEEPHYLRNLVLVLCLVYLLVFLGNLLGIGKPLSDRDYAEIGVAVFCLYGFELASDIFKELRTIRRLLQRVHPELEQ